MSIWGGSSWGSKATQLVERVVAAINARDFETLRGLVTSDVRFVDSMGDGIAGQDQAFLMLERLVAYDPDLRINIDGLTDHGDAVLMSGDTAGAREFSSDRTLWKIVLRDGRVAEWRSYSADNPRPVIRMLMGSSARTIA